MTGELRHVGDDGPALCTFCSSQAVGPCASCRRPVCGDCCTLTEGGVKTWAVCLDCDRKKGRSLLGPWGGLLRFLGAILLVLIALVVLVEWLGPKAH